MRHKLNATHILDAIRALRAEGVDGASSSEIHARAGGSYATVGRLLERLVQEAVIVRQGKARATRYLIAPVNGDLCETAQVAGSFSATISPGWTAPARAVFEQLNRPLGARDPVTYQRRFVDDYKPNESFLLPRDLADTLAQEGKMLGQQPAATYARRVLEQLLIDLSWSSSRLEGNTYSLLATEALFKSGAPPTDSEGVMLLNHKGAIEFLVDAVPTHGLTDGVIRNLHALLMQDLLSDSAGLGAIRNKIVNISDTTYVPSQMPQLLDEMLSLVIGKAQHIKNPAEAAFFLWVNLAYLQPFEDGNKCTSRLAANIPLMLYNCAPLAFIDVEPHGYAKAMIAVYELLDLTIAVELFAWTYRRSIRKYKVILEAMGSPDAFRVRHRETLTDAVQRIVRDGQPFQRVISDINLPAEETASFKAMLEAELEALTPYNCARYRLTLQNVQTWIDSGRTIQAS